MGTMSLMMAPILLQGLVTAIDEFYFHQKRGLGTWEIWGHPLDTLTVASAYGFLLWAEPTTKNMWIFGAMAIFSCAFVTKDEFVHHELCTPWEQWLHSILFLLHPTAFLAAAMMWQAGALQAIQIQLVLVAIFFVYQILYWGKPWLQRTR